MDHGGDLVGEPTDEATAQDGTRGRAQTLPLVLFLLASCQHCLLQSLFSCKKNRHLPATSMQTATSASQPTTHRSTPCWPLLSNNWWSRPKDPFRKPSLKCVGARQQAIEPAAGWVKASPLAAVEPVHFEKRAGRSRPASAAPSFFWFSVLRRTRAIACTHKKAKVLFF